MCPYHHRSHGAKNRAAFTLPDVTVDENTPLPYRVFHALRGVMGLHKQLVIRRLAEKNAHPGQAISLWALSQHEGLSQAELADVLNVARPTVTIMLGKMERSGLVERRADETDKRVTRIYLTGGGRGLHAELKQIHDSVVSDTIGPLTEKDQLELERLLRLVDGNIERALAGEAR